MLNNNTDKERLQSFLSTFDAPYNIEDGAHFPYTVDVDGLKTTITNIQGNFAQGFVTVDGSNSSCFIAKGSGLFAHGKTIKEAFKALQDKINQQLPLNKRLEVFKSKFPNFQTKVKAQELYEWHFYLTGSCSFGRKLFMKEHNIKGDDMVSVQEFLEMSKDSYGGEVISLLLV